MPKTVKENTEENIRLLEGRIVELKKILHDVELGIHNLQETVDNDKKYLATL
jgi:archaellum component FlaC